MAAEIQMVIKVLHKIVVHSSVVGPSKLINLVMIKNIPYAFELYI